MASSEGIPEDVEARFRIMADHAPVLLWMAGTNAECEFFNQPWLAFTGRSMEQEVGVGWAAGVHFEDFQACMETYLASFVARRAFRMEYRLRRADGEYRWILDQGAPRFSPEGVFEGYIGSCIDITEMKEAEARVRQLNAELEGRVRQRTAELADAVRESRDANAALRQTQSALVQREKLAGLGQLLAGVAHEINNPLSFVSNNLAVLQRDSGALSEVVSILREGEEALAAARPDVAERARKVDEEFDVAHIQGALGGLFDRTREGLRRIQQIVRNLRDFARLDEGDVHEADLNDGVVATVNIIGSAARRRHVEVEMDLGERVVVTCFSAKINQVVMNLLANAIDASPDGAKVLVRTRADDDGARIEVVDHGVGIDPAILPRIFDPFFTTKPPGLGTGLGLSISYGIVQDHGGAIEVESEVGRGSRFTVKLPRQPPMARPSRVPG
jgi:PAS domain S-box-containing protein